MVKTFRISEIEGIRDWLLWSKDSDSALNTLAKHMAKKNQKFDLNDLIVFEQDGMIEFDLFGRMNQIG
jgi:hypothetical protein